jgi:NTP pyrophosphatase (non-canonical NTP hydrolase)
VTRRVINVGEIQEAAWANKIAKDFNTDNVDREFNLLRAEVAEAYEAWLHGDGRGLAGELADVAIFLAGLSQMVGVDLEQAVIEKLAVNARRTYTRGINGVQIKTEPASTPDTP